MFTSSTHSPSGYVLLSLPDGLPMISEMRRSVEALTEPVNWFGLGAAGVCQPETIHGCVTSSGSYGMMLLFWPGFAPHSTVWVIPPCEFTSDNWSPLITSMAVDGGKSTTMYSSTAIREPAPELRSTMRSVTFTLCPVPLNIFQPDRSMLLPVPA